MNNNSKAYKQGHSHYVHNGDTSFNDNPFEIETTEFDDWENGWYDAQEEFNNKDNKTYFDDERD